MRRICPDCRRPAEGVVPEEMVRLAASPGAGDAPTAAPELHEIQLYEGAGCDTCSHTGYQGRSGVYELLVVDEPIRQHVLKHASADAIREQAIASGMRTLREDSWLKVSQGQTTVAEIIRVTRD